LVTPLFSAYLRLFMLRALPQAESRAYAKTLSAAAVPGNNEVFEVPNALRLWHKRWHNQKKYNRSV
jgi:hypothetical protein